MGEKVQEHGAGSLLQPSPVSPLRLRFPVRAFVKTSVKSHLGHRIYGVAERRDLSDENRFPLLQEFLHGYYIPVWFSQDDHPAMFSPELWNHGRDGEDEMVYHPKTTCAVESFDRTLNRMDEMKDHRFRTIFSVLRKELGKTRVRLATDPCFMHSIEGKRLGGNTTSSRL
jgi:hypothetical protein